MEQSTLVGPGFSQTPIGALRQSVLVDAALTSLQANAGFRERYALLGHALNGDLGRYLRIDVTDARKGLMTCAVFLHRKNSGEFDWIEWVNALGLPPTGVNFQHNVRVQAHPVITHDIIGDYNNDFEVRELVRFALKPINRYGYMGLYEDLDIALAAMKTPLELITFEQFRL